MKYIDAAVERLKTKKTTNESELSLIEKILAKESNPKIAYILALDLMLVGIDTVNFNYQFKIDLIFSFTFCQ